MNGVEHLNAASTASEDSPMSRRSSCRRKLGFDSELEQISGVGAPRIS